MMVRMCFFNVLFQLLQKSIMTAFNQGVTFAGEVSTPLHAMLVQNVSKDLYFKNFLQFALYAKNKDQPIREFQLKKKKYSEPLPMIPDADCLGFDKESLYSDLGFEKEFIQGIFQIYFAFDYRKLPLFVKAAPCQ